MRRASRARNAGEIEGDDAETARLDDEVGGFEGFFGAAAATHPEKMGQMHAGIARRRGDRSNLPASIRAQNSGRRVARARAAIRMLVRPEDGGPQISVRVPRGISMLAMTSGQEFRRGFLADREIDAEPLAERFLNLGAERGLLSYSPFVRL